METTHDNYFYKYKRERKSKEELKNRMLKQIQGLLVDNKQLQDELTEANRTIEVYIKTVENPISKQK